MCDGTGETETGQLPWARSRVSLSSFFVSDCARAGQRGWRGPLCARTRLGSAPAGLSVVTAAWSAAASKRSAAADRAHRDGGEDARKVRRRGGEPEFGEGGCCCRGTEGEKTQKRAWRGWKSEGKDGVPASPHLKFYPTGGCSGTAELHERKIERQRG